MVALTVGILIFFGVLFIASIIGAVVIALAFATIE